MSVVFLVLQLEKELGLCTETHCLLFPETSVNLDQVLRDENNQQLSHLPLRDFTFSVQQSLDFVLIQNRL